MHASQVNTDMSQKRTFRELIKAEFEYDCTTDVKIIKGSNASDILGWKSIADIDLIVMGVKPRSVSSGRHAAKILNGSLCSVLLVPTSAISKISKVLLPLDFSKNSVRAMSAVTAIQKKNPLEIILQHVFFVPTGYSSTGKSYDQFAKIMQKNKEKEYKAFKKKYSIDDTSYDVVFTLDEDDKPSDNIYELADQRGVDMIVMGSSGKTKAASLLLRSTAIGLLKYDEDIPCLIVKDKRKSIGFFQALMRV